MFIVIAIVAFGVVVGIHEFGHFVAAKSLGVKVNEFSIGMGPAVFKRQKGETLYALRCLPIGGYCAMEGEDEDTGDERSFARQPGWKKVIVLSAGSFMNFVLGLALVLVTFSAAYGFNSTVLASASEGNPYVAEDALHIGDRIYSIDGHRTYYTGNISMFLNRGADTSYDIVVIRGGERVELKDFTLERYEQPDGSESYGLAFETEEKTLLNTLKYGWYTSIDFVRQSWMALQDLVTGVFGLEDLSGVVGRVDMINEVGNEGVEQGGFGFAMMDVAYLVALLAVNIAVMNMLPIPALDGGRVLFVLVNGAAYLFTRRRIPARFEGYVHAGGMVLMLGLMAVVMVSDILKIVR